MNTTTTTLEAHADSISPESVGGAIPPAPPTLSEIAARLERIETAQHQAAASLATLVALLDHAAGAFKPLRRVMESFRP